MPYTLEREPASTEVLPNRRKIKKARAVAAAALASLALISPVKAEQEPELMIGVVENNVLSLNPDLAQKRIDLIKRMGANTLRVNMTWGHGMPHPREKDFTRLSNAAQAASRAGIRLFVSFYPVPGEPTAEGKATPLTATQKGQFCDYVDRHYRALPTVEDIQIGNEPNSSLFWQPQYGPDGKSRAPKAYVNLLARCYDTLKRTAEELGRSVTIYGPALASKGNGNPSHERPSHPPEDFIRKMGKALIESGREQPVLDVFTIHPYEESNAASPKREQRPNSTTIGFADYQKLNKIIKEAFNGSAQPTENLKILYDEFAVQTTIPPRKLHLYKNEENVLTVDEPTQALYLKQSLEMAYCQPNSIGVFTFLSVDELDLTRWQSGLLYGNETPKTSFPEVRKAIQEVQSGQTNCELYK